MILFIYLFINKKSIFSFLTVKLLCVCVCVCVNRANFPLDHWGCSPLPFSDSLVCEEILVSLTDDGSNGFRSALLKEDALGQSLSGLWHCNVLSFDGDLLPVSK